MVGAMGDIVQGPGRFWQENQGSIEAFVVYGAGILAYALVVNLFYQVISKRVMFARANALGAGLRGPAHGLGYFTLMPLVSFAFFVLLSLSLLFLGGPEQSPVHVITLSFALVAAVRIAAYFSEPASHDVAKMLPLGVLGAVIAQSQFSTLADSMERMLHLFEHTPLISFYFLTVVLLEFILRTAYVVIVYERRPRDLLPRGLRATMDWSVFPLP